MSEDGRSATVPQFIVSTEGELFGEDTLENREIVRRIHACVNACEGLATEELESGIVEDMRRVIAEVAPLLKNQVAKRRSAAPQKTIVVDDSPQGESTTDEC